MTLQEIDWEIDRIIESSKSLEKTSSVFASSFPFLLLKRYYLFQNTAKLSFKQDFEFIDVNTKAFSERFQRYKDNGSKVFWNNQDNQFSRFEELLKIGDINNSSILDIGCGYGDLLTYLERVNITPSDYLGIDLSPKIINIAQQQHPSNKFLVFNILNQESEPSSWDYCLGSGIFALKIQNWSRHVLSVLRKLYIICREGVAVNFELGNGYNDKNSIFKYVTYDEINNIVTQLSVFSFNLTQTNDFLTLFLYKK